MLTFTDRAKNVSPSLTLAITAKANQMKAEGVDLISFAAGEPDFNTPEFICKAAINAINKGYTKYTAASGLPALKQAVCAKLKRDNNLDYTPDQIVVSTGAKQCLFNAVQAVVQDGDEVIIIAPYWLTYPELVRLAGGITVYVKSGADTGYKMTAEQLKNAITDKTKLLILNSPNNPTGAVYNKEELAEIAKVCEEKGIYVISDEIYEKLVYGGKKHVSIAALSPYMKEHTVVVNGMSKSYSMTGWRIGYIAAPSDIAKAVSSMQSHTTSNACSIAQYASVAALESEESDAFIEKMQKTFDERRKYMVKTLGEINGVVLPEPKGAFYVFADVSAFYGKSFGDEKITGSLSFADAALKKGVAVVPGIAFGDDRCIRLSYAISIEDIKEGLNRLKDFITEIR